MVADGGTTAERAAIEERVLVFLRQELLPAGAEVDAGTALLADEGLDSINALRLAHFVAGSFGIALAPSDFVVENFETVAAIASFVSRARARGAPDPSAR
jgi:acyl carrier protein